MTNYVDADALIAWINTNKVVPPTTPPVTPPAGPVPSGAPGNWTLAWSDEFTGTALDATKWSTGWFGTGVTVPVGGTAESAAYDPAQVSVAGGYLNLTTKTSSATVGGHTYPYRSGLVSTNGKYQFTYGFAEARINALSTIPSGTAIANWPAFWTDGQSWPEDGEIDIMEGISGQAQYHAHSPSGGPGAAVPGNFTGWHTYGVDWEAGLLTFYYDGKVVGTLPYDRTSPNYLILNYAMGGGNPIVSGAQMQVDYVRVWSKT